MPDFAQVDQAYRELLGRSLTEGEFGFWAGNDNFRNEIAGSPEAVAFRSRTSTPPPDVVLPAFNAPVPEGFDAVKWRDLNYHSEKYDFGRAWAGDPNRVAAAAAVIGAEVLDPMTIRTRAGRVIDLYRASSTQGFANPQWLDVTESPF